MKYELIVAEIEKLIESGALAQGKKLPSIRTMSDKYDCSNSTVIRAYKELEYNHKIFSIPKSGYYVVDKINPITKREELIDFSKLTPSYELLPYREFNHSINKAVEIYKGNLFSYGETQGLSSLRCLLVDHFANDQIFTSKENIVITTGAQQGLNLLFSMPFPNNKESVLVEDPTYDQVHEIGLINNINILKIPRTTSGIDLNVLEDIFKNEDIKFFYTIPRFHNPLGTTYSEKIKKDIVELANKYNVYIVEDDYLSDINMNKKVLPLHYYDTHEKVIYVRSFSKTFMPGIRIAALLLQNNLRDEFLRYKRASDLNTCVLTQGALEIFINSGMYKNHVKKVRREYAKKIHCLKESFDKHKSKILLFGDGVITRIRIPKEISLQRLLKDLENRHVRVYHNTGENEFTICISNLHLKQIKEGIRIICEEINKSITM